MEIDYYWETEDDQRDDPPRIHLANIKGTLVLASQMDYDPVEVCDDEDQDLGYVMSTTEDIVDETLFYLEYYTPDENVPFPIVDGQEKLTREELLQQIVDSLPDTLLQLDGARPDVIAVYPAALEYKEDEATKAQREIAMEALRQKMAAMEELHRPLKEGEPENRVVLSFTNGYELTQ